jgi:hypothetical protein
VAYNAQQFAKLIETVLLAVGLHSPEAVALLQGTAAVESLHGTYLYQLGTNNGALGVFQIEPRTGADAWYWLRDEPDLRRRIGKVTGVYGPDKGALVTNLAYQVVIARLVYRRVMAPLPAADDVHGQARYWKKYYNTKHGSGDVLDYINKRRVYVDGMS